MHPRHIGIAELYVRPSEIVPRAIEVRVVSDGIVKSIKALFDTSGFEVTLAERIVAVSVGLIDL